MQMQMNPMTALMHAMNAGMMQMQPPMPHIEILQPKPSPRIEIFQPKPIKDALAIADAAAAPETVVLEKAPMPEKQEDSVALRGVQRCRPLSWHIVPSAVSTALMNYPWAG